VESEPWPHSAAPRPTKQNSVFEFQRKLGDSMAFARKALVSVGKK